MKSGEITPPSSLAGAHLRTYEKIFQHPISHGLTWREIRALLANMSRVVESPNGNLLAERDGRTYVLHSSATHNAVASEDLMKLRHFLTTSENPSVPAKLGDGHVLVVINHHEAHIHQLDQTETPPKVIWPPSARHEPGRHEGHADDFSRGREKPAEGAFFSPIAAELKDAIQIIVFGGGKGSSSEMTTFLEWLDRQHPELARRVIGSQVIDEHHLTDGQLREKARRFHPSLTSTGGNPPAKKGSGNR